MEITQIDKVYIINLPNRTDRFVDCQNRIKKLAVLKNKTEIIAAIDGKNIENKTKLKNGELGCSLSHIKIWNDAIAKDYKFILVLEDDVVFKEDFEENLNVYLNQVNTDFDWIYLFNTWDYRPVIEENDYFFKVIASLGTQAYIIKIKSLGRILPFVKEFEYPIDVVMGHMSFLSKVFRTKKIFVQHDEQSPSDIRSQNNKKSKLSLKNLLSRL